MPTYAKTTWVNGGPPALNATNLGNMESGIFNAYDSGVIEVDSFTGTDDAKLSAAVSYAAAQTYKPTMRLSSREWVFNAACPAPFKGFKLTGAGYGASVEQPRSNHPYATLVDINYTAAPWMTFTERIDGFYLGNLAIRGSSSATFMTRDSGSNYAAMAATGVMENLGFDAWEHVIGTPSIPMLFTAFNMTGWWNINNAQGTQITLGGSDNNLWMEGMLIDCALPATAIPLITLSYADLTVCGPVYMTASGPSGSAGTSGGLAITSGQQRTVILNGWRLGGRSVSDEHQGALITITGDCVTMISDSWISQTDPSAGGDSAIIEVSGGAKVVLDRCVYKPHTGASSSIVWAQVSGSTSTLRVSDCFGTTTSYPINVKSVSSGVLVADSSVTDVT